MTFASGTTPLFFLMTKYLFDESVLVNYCISSPGSKVAMLPIGYAALINHTRRFHLLSLVLVSGSYLIATCSRQKATDSAYLDLSKGTPLPPSSLPRAFLIIVMGCMGNS